MGITATDSGGKNFDPVPEGTHHAICYGVYDLGTQRNPVYNNSQHKVLICWELPDERIDVEKNDRVENLPRAVSKIYTVSLHEKSNLRKDLENWRGKAFTKDELEGFDLTKLLGVNCMTQIIHNRKEDRTYAKVSSIIPLIDPNMRKSPENEIRYFSFEEGTPIPEGTPDWIVDFIKQADEWNASFQNDDDGPPPITDDDIPF